MGRKKGSKNIIVKSEDEGKKLPAKIILENEGKDKLITVTRTTLSFNDAKDLKAGSIIKHVRVMKVISITHKDDGSAAVELEIIKRNWENTSF